MRAPPRQEHGSRNADPEPALSLGWGPCPGGVGTRRPTRQRGGDHPQGSAPAPLPGPFPICPTHPGLLSPLSPAPATTLSACLAPEALRVPATLPARPHPDIRKPDALSARTLARTLCLLLWLRAHFGHAARLDIHSGSSWTPLQTRNSQVLPRRKMAINAGKCKGTTPWAL